MCDLVSHGWGRHADRPRGGQRAMARRHRQGCLPRPTQGRARTRTPRGGLVKGRRSDSLLIWLLSRAALLAAVWAAAVALLRRRRRPAPEAVLEAVPVTPSYAGGSGTPLVLLHGGGGTWRVGRPVLPLLERWHAVFAPTLPGHCGAERLAAGVAPSIQALADGVVEQLDRAGIDRAHIAGNSLGGGGAPGAA